MGLTLVNFYVALDIGLRLPPGNQAFELIIGRLLQSALKGLFSDPSRYELMIQMWNLAFQRTVKALGIVSNCTDSETEKALL